MKKLLSYVIIFVFLSISANALLITPQTNNPIVYTNQPLLLNVSIVNNLNYTIYNISVIASTSDPKISFVFPNIPNMTIGEEKNATILISVSDAIQSNFDLTFFFYNKSDIILTPENKDININANGFNSSNLNIIKGATVTWKNIDTISHTVTSSLFDQTISPSGGQFSYTFNDVGVVNYFDNIGLKAGILNVLDVTSTNLVQDPSKNINVNFNLQGIKVDTDISLELLDNANFTLNPSQTGNGVLKLSNTGTLTAIGLFMTGNWIIFQKNNFTLAPGTSTFVSFEITPIVQGSNDTGKSYNIPLSLRGENILQKEVFLNVTIPFTENVNKSFAEDELKKRLDEFRQFCNANPGICKGETIVEKEVPVFRESEVPYNFTQRQIANMISNYMSLTGDFDRIANEIKSDVNSVNSKTDSFSADLNKTGNRVGAIEENISDLKDTVKIVFGSILGIVIIGLIAGIVVFVMFIKNKSDMNKQYKT